MSCDVWPFSVHSTNPPQGRRCRRSVNAHALTWDESLMVNVDLVYSFRRRFRAGGSCSSLVQDGRSNSAKPLAKRLGVFPRAADIRPCRAGRLSSSHHVYSSLPLWSSLGEVLIIGNGDGDISTLHSLSLTCGQLRPRSLCHCQCQSCPNEQKAAYHSAL